MPKKKVSPCAAENTAKQPNPGLHVGLWVTSMRAKIQDAQPIPMISEHLLQLDEAKPSTLAEADVVMLARTLADAMAAHPQDAKLQTSVCSCLRKLANKLTCHRVCFDRQNTLIPAIVNAMNNYANDLTLQTSAIHALASITTNFSKQHPVGAHMPPQETMDSKMMAALHALEKHATRVDINTHALCVMESTHSYSSASCKLLVEGSAIGLIVRSMRAFSDCFVLQISGSVLLSHLINYHGQRNAHGQKNKDIFWKEGTLSVLLRAMDFVLLGNDTERHCRDTRSLYVLG
jgi:hypothetical protein